MDLNYAIYFEMGWSVIAIMILMVICLMYFSHKHLITLATTMFSDILIITLLLNIVDLLNSVTVVYDSVFSIGFQFFVNYMEGFLDILLFPIIILFCYLNTYGRNQVPSIKYMYILVVPAAVSELVMLAFTMLGDFSIIDGVIRVTKRLYFLPLVNATIYVLLSLFFVYRYAERGSRPRRLSYLIMTVAFYVIMLVCSLKYNVYAFAVLVTLTIMVLYSQIMMRQNYVTVRTNRFDQQALSMKMSDTLMFKKDFSLVIVSFNNFNFVSSRVGYDEATDIVDKISKLLPTDTKNTSVFDLGNETFVIMCFTENRFRKTLEEWSVRQEKGTISEDISLRLPFALAYYRVNGRRAESMDVQSLIKDGISYCKRYNLNVPVDLNLAMKDIMRESHVQSVLEKAIKNDELEVFFQPIYDVKKDCFDKAEALARLKDGENGYIPPGEFIPLAEERGLVLDVGRCVLRKTCQYMDSYKLVDMGVKEVNVNLSALELLQDNLSEMVAKELEAYSISNENLVLEITETASIGSEQVVENNVAMLSEDGFTFALDDYGTGYSSMERVLKLPFKCVKIDKSVFYMSFVDERNDRVLTNNIEMLKQCGYEVVVEGAETEEQVNKLKQKDVDFIQGFYYSQPLPINEYIEFLKSSKTC